MRVVDSLLEASGIEPERLRLRWVSAAEGQLFAEYIKDYSEVIKGLGPFDSEKFETALGAMKTSLASPRLRWLTGMEIQITERGNVYGEKADEAAYQNMLKKAAEEEFHKALILEVLKEGPSSLREIALATGLPLYTVSLRLNDLERAHCAGLLDYEGTTPRFAV
jgi:F420-non-reducing hydrogenase iron-sulfur subunit